MPAESAVGLPHMELTSEEPMDGLKYRNYNKALGLAKSGIGGPL